MRLLLSIAVVVVVIAGLALVFGNRLIVDRHTVGKFTIPVPTTNDPIPGNLVWGGLQSALQNSGMDPLPWAVSPSSQWQEAEGLPRTNQGSVRIILSNRVDGSKLYARVALVSSNALEYDIYRPK